MNIRDIIENNDLVESMTGRADIDIVGISNDSRRIKNGFLFAARKGVNVDSNIYIEEAISKGASAILTDDAVIAEKFKNKDTVIIKVKDALKAYAVISKNFFDNPAERLRIVGVTGTNGKTTTTFLIKSILKAAGNNAGLIGTIDYEIGDNTTQSKNTTPDAYELNLLFSETVKSGGGYCVMEVSSHSLAQDRVFGVPFDVAVFTNLTRDHLDYHENMEKYYESKKKLFSEVLLKSSKNKKFAVINNDDRYGKRLIGELKDGFKKESKIDILTYGLGEDSDIYACNINYYTDGLKLDIIFPGNNAIREIRSNLIGGYNVYNILAAVSAAYVLSIAEDFIISGIESLVNVPGRIEKVNTGDADSPLICIDYAHTDDALKRVLSALKDIGGGRLISVFGCGGDRDKGKRPLMGKHSTDIADISIITSDNPRSEDPLSIIREIESGIKNALFADKCLLKNDTGGHVYTIEEDRVNAIKLALTVASKKDVVLIAGKGHEDYMIVKENKFHFSDKEEVLKYYENRI
ncbi:MAG: UDP-N-acetylmuramoyl-L-alanyl-D-glutamate--2,6-diaminopimelate ligase [Deltaproteobacteria bacterium]|nr:UDP-N-acetylmuramoyl-L-alanyl-D-glutamate--2,6-diaminopimelate ligase [Deltaproteobacteria bacterium]